MSNFEQQTEIINNFLRTIPHKLLIMSGKGGVGKSTVAASLAVALSNQGFKTGLLDIDVHGPSIAGILGLTGYQLNFVGNKLTPYLYNENLKVVSMQGLLDDPDTPVIWRGPLKIHAVRDFLANVDWGELDYLVIDSPPGTGDEPLTIAQIIPDCQAIIVTTPQEVALADVRKSIKFCQQVKMPVLGIVENMSGFVCPSCGARHDIFKTGGGIRTAEKFNIPFLGSLPIDPSIVVGGDTGTPVVKPIEEIADKVIKYTQATNVKTEEGNVMSSEKTEKIAVPDRQR